jgi:beta-mannanase
MRSVFALAALAATAHAAAAPWASWGTNKATSKCMSDSEAKKVANNFKTLIDEYSDKLANATLTEDFIDYSDSVGELINGGCTEGGSFTVRCELCCDYPCLQTSLRHPPITCIT